MKKTLILLYLLNAYILSGMSQTLIKSENDSTFTTEFINGEEWAIIAKDGFIVGVNNKLVKDDYGKFYKLQIIIYNKTDKSYTFEPDSINSYCTLKNESYNQMKVYTSESFQKMIKNKQAWATAFMGFANGLNAGMAANSTSYVSTPYGGYTANTYNTGSAAIANMIATNQMIEMDKQMKNDLAIKDEGYLKKNTIHPEEGIIGYMFVKRQKGKTMDVIIPINNTSYRYRWNIDCK